MKTVRCTPGQVEGLIRRRVKTLHAAFERARNRIPHDAVHIVRENAPKAFGDLRRSVHAEIHRTVVDAPHAGAVEQGSMPHTPNFEALVAWVKLRGTQSLRGHLPWRHGTTTKSQVLRVRDLLRQETRANARGGRYSPVDAPEQVAAKIAKGIEAEGTKPHWFVRSSLPGVAARYLELLQNARRRGHQDS